MGIRMKFKTKLHPLKEFYFETIFLPIPASFGAQDFAIPV